MSESTQQALQRANEAVARADANLTLSKREALSIIADKIPAAVDQRAKEIAHKHPDVTRNLGQEGVKNFRKDLAESAEKLATHVRTGEDNIEWPDKRLVESSRFWGSSPKEVRNAICDYMNGSPINEVEAVFARYGYQAHIHIFDGRVPQLLSQSLCAIEDVNIIAEALEQLADAQSAQERAKTDDDQATVNDLWE